MKIRHLALAMAALATALHAEPARQSVVAVGAAQIRLAAPAGYGFPTCKSEAFWRKVESLMPPKGRVLAMYIADGDALAFERGGEPDFRRYFIVQSMRSTEGHSYSPGEFPSVKDSMRSHFNRNRSYTSTYVQEFIDSKAREINKQLGADLLSMKMGEQRMLEILDESESSLSVLAVQRSSLTAGEYKDDTPKIMSVSYVKLQDRVIFFFAYSQFNTAADIEWVRSETKQWVANNVAINARPNQSLEPTRVGRPPLAAQLQR